MHIIYFGHFTPLPILYTLTSLNTQLWIFSFFLLPLFLLHLLLLLILPLVHLLFMKSTSQNILGSVSCPKVSSPQSGVMTLKKSESPFPRSFQMSIAPQLLVRICAHLSPSPLSQCFFFILFCLCLCKSCAFCLSCCDFLCVTKLLCPENTAWSHPLLLAIKIFLYLLSQYSWRLWGDKCISFKAEYFTVSYSLNFGQLRVSILIVIYCKKKISLMMVEKCIVI